MTLHSYEDKYTFATMSSIIIIFEISKQNEAIFKAYLLISSLKVKNAVVDTRKSLKMYLLSFNI
jgi:hypothetical protein